jgi:hypothetical protein
VQIEFNVIAPLSKLERTKRRRYTYSDIAEIGNLSRQTVRNVIVSSPAQVNMETLSGILRFFEREGMPLDIADLFDVRPDPTN